MRLGDPEISADIIESCRQGDRDAFRVVYEAHKDRVYSVALYFFHGDVQTASDVTQQVFLNLMKGFHRFRGDSAFTTWLHRLVVNTCVDTARRTRTRAAFAEPPDYEAVGTHPQQEAGIAQAQLANAVQAAVSTLPPVFRIAILLRYFEDLSYDQMAEVLNCSKGTVSSRLSRGHRLLAGKLSALKGWLGTREM